MNRADTKILFALPLGLLLMAFVAAPTASAQNKLVIRARHVHLDPDQGLAFPALLLADGKVTEVAARPDAKSKAPFEGQADEVLDFPNGVITAGFVDLHNTIGDRRELREAVESFTPELRAALAYDPYYRGWRSVNTKGVTSAIFSPDDGNLAGGLAVFVKPGADGAAARGDAYLKFSFTRDMLSNNRRPTSLMGSVDYLRENFDALKSGTASSPALKVLGETVGGGRPVGIACREPAEILAALDLAENYQVSAFLIHADRADKCMAQIKEAGVSVALDCLSFSSTNRQLELPLRLAREGVPFAFAGESERETTISNLQRSMAIAVRRGLAPSKALAAATTVPAGLAGLAARVGSLFQGRDADLCVWSGEPWDLRSRLLLVVRDGKVLVKAEGATEPSSASQSAGDRDKKE